MLPVAIYGSTSNVVIEVLWHQAWLLVHLHVVMHLKHRLTRLRIINLTRAHSSLHHLHFPFWRLALIRDVPWPSIFSEIVIAVVVMCLSPFFLFFMSWLFQLYVLSLLTCNDRSLFQSKVMPQGTRPHTLFHSKYCSAVCHLPFYNSFSLPFRSNCCHALILFLLVIGSCGCFLHLIVSVIRK